MNKRLTILICAVFLIATISASSGVVVRLEDSGKALFFGQGVEGMNLPRGVELKEDGTISGSTNQLTNKEGEKWGFSISLPDSDITVYLPEESVLLNIQKGSARVEGKNIVVSGNDSVDFEYELGHKSRDIVLYALSIFFAILIVLVLYIGYNRTKRNGNGDLEAVKSVMYDRDKKIIEILEENGRMKASKLRKMADDMPKASFSRHIQELEKKGVIIRNGEGRNKFVELVKNFKDDSHHFI
ncbi:MAG: winged helix-turn-helix transcriptional regulator [Nanoarchaeota archaeon]|nr:winged helix-turn-helix transcriptional regulator [Nanoarchaeota archaeon]